MASEMPEKKGYITVYPEILDNRNIGCAIDGDAEGLRYFASLLEWLADQNSADNSGICPHEHLHRTYQLADDSCEVLIAKVEPPKD